ncbi:hypothetical protein [Streptomyces sp. NPDC000878]
MSRPSGLSAGGRVGTAGRLSRRLPGLRLAEVADRLTELGN